MGENKWASTWATSASEVIVITSLVIFINTDLPTVAFTKIQI